MRLVNYIVNDAGFVIHDSDTLLIQTHLIVVDVCIHVQVSADRSRFTKLDLVVANHWLAGPSLDIYAGCVARQDFVMVDEEFILGNGGYHETAAFEMCEN